MLWQEQNNMYLLLVSLFGLIFGSFLNVCIYRLPKDKSIVTPPSSCPGCNNRIQWYDNIPVLSFILLMGRCRNCKAVISLRYPLVEIMTAVTFALLYLKFGLTLAFFKFVIFFVLLIVVSFIDIDYHAIPVYFCFIGIIVGMVFSIVETIKYARHMMPEISAMPVYLALKGLIFGFGFAYLFKFFGDIFLGIYMHFKKVESIEGETESLGLGDVDFLGMVGVFLGVKGAVLTFFIAPFVAIIYAVFAFIFKKSHLIPYLPYLSAGALVAFLWGDAIIRLIF